MSTRTKGRNAEKEYRQKWIDRGYITEIVKGSSKFNQGVDFIRVDHPLGKVDKKTGSIKKVGLFDGFAFNEKEFVFFQVKSNSTAGAPKLIKAWLEKVNFPKNMRFIVAVREDNKSPDKRWREIEIAS